MDPAAECVFSLCNAVVTECALRSPWLEAVLVPLEELPTASIGKLVAGGIGQRGRGTGECLDGEDDGWVEEQGSEGGSW